jgi:hypothetical protein
MFSELWVLDHETHSERHKKYSKTGNPSLLRGSGRIKLATFNNLFLPFFILI